MKFCVLGLGRFGYQTAITLADNGMEIMAVDSDEALVASIRDRVTQAVCMNVIDEGSLRAIGIEQMDTVIVGMAEEVSQSILITALLKKRLQVKRVIARSTNEIHKEILELIGADLVIQPEQEMGTKLAYRLSFPFVDFIKITDSTSVSEITTPKDFVGKTLNELQLPFNFKIRCIGVLKEDFSVIIDNKYKIKEGDKVILFGNNKELENIAKL